jgi:hypothetical protein
MKQFGLRFLYKHLGQALKEMPFEITNHNRVIAVVTTPYDIEKAKLDAEPIKNEPKELN